MSLLQLKILYIDDSQEDADRFREYVLGHPKLKHFKSKVFHCTSIGPAIHWLKGQGTGSVDFIILDPGAPGLNGNNLHKALQELKKYVEPDSVIALPEGSTPDIILQILKNYLGEESVYDKDQALSTVGWPQFLSQIESIVAKRSSSGSRSLEYSLLRLQTDMEMAVSEVKNRLDLISRDVDNLEDRVLKLDQTIFQGPTTESPSLITWVQELRRLIASHDKEIGKLDTDIGNLATLANARFDELKKEIGGLAKTQTEASLQIRLKRMDFWQRVGFLAIATLVALGLVKLAGLGIAEVLELIKAVVS